VDSSDDAIIGKTLEGTITSWNKAAERLYGYSAAEAVGWPIGIIVPPERTRELEDILERIRKGERVEHHETVRVAKDGRRVDVSVTVSPILDASGTVVGASTIARDITGRKWDEKERGVMVEFLCLVNEARSTRELVQKTVTFFQRNSDCEAVGIRLPEGDDYPYYEARGFSPEFIRKENLLCTRDERGCILRDEDWVPTLECMCGNIISGRFDPSRPFFTANGSFWTNSSSELLATATEKDLLTKTRNACIYEGYE
jgi:PAS domain S-box-containing protein